MACSRRCMRRARSLTAPICSSNVLDCLGHANRNHHAHSLTSTMVSISFLRLWGRINSHNLQGILRACKSQFMRAGSNCARAQRVSVFSDDISAATAESCRAVMQLEQGKDRTLPGCFRAFLETNTRHLSPIGRTYPTVTFNALHSYHDVDHGTGSGFARCPGRWICGLRYAARRNV